MADISYIDLDNYQSLKLIDGVIVHPLMRARRGEIDPRGYLVEMFRSDWTDMKFTDAPPAMTYTSFTYKSVARDEDQWHIHPGPGIAGGLEQYDRWTFIGKAVAVVADPGTKALNLFKIGTGWGNSGFFAINIPPHKYHGFFSAGGILDDEGKEGVWLFNWPNHLYNYENPALIEGRVPYLGSGVRLPDGSEFNWNAVRKNLGL